MKEAKLSVFSKRYKELGGKYLCKNFWPVDCFCQCGDSGIVLKNDSINEVFNSENPLKEVINNVAYETAFFEAFPRNPNTFIRGEGKSIEEAEENAWKKYSKYSNCTHPEFERKTYTNGVGFCTECGMFKSHAFEPLTKCIKCNNPTNHGTDKDGNWYCEKHYRRNDIE